MKLSQEPPAKSKLLAHIIALRLYVFNQQSPSCRQETATRTSYCVLIQQQSPRSPHNEVYS